MTDIIDKDWPVAPLIGGEWSDLAPELVDKLHAQLQDHELLGIEREILQRIRVFPLECYPGYLSVEALLGSATVKTAVTWFLYGPTGAHLLDGKSEVLHSLNDTGALQVNDAQSASQYLRLFCAAVHGDEGPFLVIESERQLNDFIGNVAGIAPPNIDTLHGVEILPRFGGAWSAKACVYYAGAVFAAQFDVTDDGQVQMVGDEPLFDAPALSVSIEGPMRTPPMGEG